MYTLRKMLTSSLCIAACLLCALNAPSQAADSAKEKARCLAAERLNSAEALRFVGLGKGAEQIVEFRVYVPTLVMLNVRTYGDAVALPKLTFLGRHCSSEARSVRGESYLSIYQTPTTHVLFLADPGSYYVGVSAQDPEQSLGRFILTARTKDAFFGTAAQVKTDPDDDESDQVEIEPDSLINPDGSDIKGAYSNLCENDQLIGRNSDHADHAICAIRLPFNQEMKGEVRNRWSDDVDVFTFTLERATTVKIEAYGEIDLFGGVFNSHGYRLNAGRVADDSGKFRQVMTLMPGRYDVSIEGRNGSEGTYSIFLETLD